MRRLHWFGSPVVDVLDYWTDGDGLGLMARVLLEGDPRPRWALASMLEAVSDR